MTKYVTCRYLRRSDEQCTAEALDSDGEILLCSKHLALAMELRNAGIRRRITAEDPAVE